MANIESKNNIKKSSKRRSKMKRLLMTGVLASTLLTSCMEKTTPLKTYKEWIETIEQYTDFDVVESDTKHEIHVKNNVNIIVYANADGGGRGMAGEVCITTEEHPKEIFSDKSFGKSEKYEIIYKK